MSCDGRCCEKFNLRDTEYDAICADPEHFTDGRMIATMLIPLDEDCTVFTCRWWDRDTRLCTVYDSRPEMCREYPRGRPCDHGCGLELP